MKILRKLGESEYLEINRNLGDEIWWLSNADLIGCEDDKETMRDRFDEFCSIRLDNPGGLVTKMMEKYGIELPSPIKSGSKLYIRYPLSCTVEIELPECKTSGELVKEILDAYQCIYEFEEESSTKKAMPLCEENPRSSLLNRNETDGCFGIWGHDLRDLVLTCVAYYSNDIIVLGIDS